MGAWREPDAAFLALVRDRATLLSMLAEIGGEVVASAHAASSATTVRSVILQYATGERRPKAEGWVPRWLAFPAHAESGDAIGFAEAA